MLVDMCRLCIQSVRNGNLCEAVVSRANIVRYVQRVSGMTKAVAIYKLLTAAFVRIQMEKYYVDSRD